MTVKDIDKIKELIDKLGDSYAKAGVKTVACMVDKRPQFPNECGKNLIQNFYSDSQDVKEFNDRYGKEYDSYFVFTSEEDGEIMRLFGMEGIIPYFHNELHEIKIKG